MSELRDGVTPEIKAVNPIACSYDVFYEACAGRLAKSPEGQRKRIERELDRLQKYNSYFELEMVYDLLKVLSAFDSRSAAMYGQLLSLRQADVKQIERISSFTRTYLNGRTNRRNRA